MKITVFCDVTPCVITILFLHVSSVLMMEVEDTSETFMPGVCGMKFLVTVVLSLCFGGVMPYSVVKIY
jgi:hypothetical protein